MKLTRRLRLPYAALMIFTVMLLIDTFGLRNSDNRTIVHIEALASEKPPTPLLLSHSSGWYDEHLRAMGEPSLWKLSKTDPDARVYRLLTLPTFTPGKVARLVVLPDHSGILNVVTLDGRGGYDPGRVKKWELVRQAKDQVLALESVFEESGFWTESIGVLQRLDQPKRVTCMDGVRYVLEAVSDGNYKLVSRHECETENGILSILDEFGALTGTGPVLRFPD